MAPQRGSKWLFRFLCTLTFIGGILLTPTLTSCLIVEITAATVLFISEELNA